jgi:hypothetical protein
VNEPVRSPDVGREGWTLESAVRRSEANPNTFLIPSQHQRSTLKVGQGVKLIFWIQGDEDFPICERMWVLIEQRLPNGDYVGRLDSVPETESHLHTGQRLVFGPEHVAEIFEGLTGYEDTGARR